MRKLLITLAGILSINLSLAQPSQIPNCVGYWVMNGTAVDISGNNHNGTVSGAILAPGIQEGNSEAYQFDGTDQISVANDATLNFGATDFTVSAWIKTSSAVNGAIVAKQSNAATSYLGWNLWFYNTGKIGFGGGVNPNFNSIETPAGTTYYDGKWHHVVAVRVGNTAANWRLYIDGVSVGVVVASAMAISDLSTTSPLLIGRRGNGETFNGNIDEVGLYNRALTSTEVTQLYTTSKLTATPTIVPATGGGNNGSVSIVVSGGNSPYTYLWSTGETIASITGKPAGQYSVVIKDALNRTATVSYSLGEVNVAWTDLTNMTVNGDNSLFKSSALATYNASAVGLNVLPAFNDGYIQTTHIAGNTNYMISLSKFNADVNYTTLDFAIQISNSGLITIYELGSSKGTFGNPVVGDVFKISREGSQIKYYKNGVVFYTSVTTANTFNLRPDIAVYYPNSTIPPIVASFDKKLIGVPQFQFPTAANNNGSITMQVSGEYAPVTYLWSSGETTSSISSKPRGTYSVTITDARGRKATYSYYLGYAVNWSNPVNVTVNADNSLTKTTTAVAYDAGASSTNVVLPNTDGFLEFVVKPGFTYSIGLTRTDPNTTYTEMLYQWYLTNIGTGAVYEGSALRGTFGSIVTGDVYRISREGSIISYYINGVLQRNVAATPGHLYMADVSIYQPGSTPVVTTSFDRQIRIKPTITNPDNTNANGSIVLSVQGVHSPSTTQWSSGETTTIISNKSRGLYSTTITDALPGHTSTRTYELGYKVNWNNILNIKVETNNSLTKISSTSAYDAGAISANALPASTDGWIEFVTDKPGNMYEIGLSRYHSNLGTAAPIDYGIYVLAGGDVAIYELGASRGVFANYEEGDIYRISREAGFIKYYRNGALLRSVATTATFVLHGELFIYNTIGNAPMITSSFEDVPQTYFARVDGNWNVPATWSLTEGGVASTTIPGKNDIVNVKGFKVDVTTGMSCQQLNITATNDNSQVKIDGALAEVKVANQVNIVGQNNPNPTKVLIVQNNGKINVAIP